MSESKQPPEAGAKIYTANKEIKSILGNAAPMSRIFSKEKMRKCQKMVNDAKESFFDVALKDMKEIEMLCGTQLTAEGFSQFYDALFQPVSNIKGQADIFDFALIATTCRHLLDYCSQTLEQDNISKKHLFIVNQLVVALRQCFNKKITDKDGKLEKQLSELMELAKQ